jgi:type I restriction enzyme S subunit
MSAIPAGYKQTEVGVIPADWAAVQAGDIGRFRGGSGFPIKYQGATSGAYPFFKVSDMNNEGNEIFMRRANNYVSEPLRKLLGATAFPSNSVVFAKVGAAVFLERKKILAQPSCLDNNMAAFVLDANRADYHFVHYSLLHTKLGDLVSTTALPSLSGSVLSKIGLPLPPISEQHAIATALSDVDALLAKLDQFIAKKRDLKQAAMQQLLTGLTRLPGFRGEWEVKRLGEACRITTGKKDVNEGNPSGPYPFFTCARASTFSDSFSFDGEAILIAGNGEVGNLNYVNGKFEAYQRTYVLQGFTANVSYLWHQLSAHLVKSLGIGTIGSSIPYIKMENLVGFEFQSPLDDDEQTAIATVLSNMDAELAALEARRDKTRALKQGMMQELLTGRIRLI